MNAKKAFAVSVGVIASTFFLFVVLYGNYTHDREQKRVYNHSKVIASAMWDFELEGMMEYLRLACKAYKYRRVIVTQDPGGIFIDLDHSLQKPIDRLLISLNLIPTANIISDVVHNEKVIGQITVTWYNTAVYIYSYALILVFLVMTVLWYYLRAVTAKLELEARVVERTADLRQEITERKRTEEALRESEEKYRSIFENAVEGFFQSTPEGRFISVNPAFAKMLGYASPEELVSNISNIAKQYYVDPEDRRRYQQILQQAGSVEDLEFRARRKDGSQIWVSNSTRAYFDEDGKVIRYEGIVNNISERKRAEEEKEELQYQLIQAHKMESIGNLAGGIAHDFNNILSAIIGYTELAIDDVENGTLLEKNLQEVYTAGKRARDLIKQILAFARQSDEELKPIRVDKIAMEVLKLIRSTIPTTIEIRQKLESNSLIMGNPTQVHQLFVNLCTNAGQAMEDAGGILEIGLVDVELDDSSPLTQSGLKPGNYLKATISDTGPGITPDIIDSIFEPYFTTKGVGEGTGMGLAMVHGIVEGYGGKITVESKLGEGAVFSIYLPITKKRDGYRPYEEEDLPSGTERILLVDDELPIAKMGSQILERLGYQVSVRTSSVEALKLFRSRPSDFDLIITDMTMPNMTGDVLAMELIAFRSDIPVILCTGYSKKISDEKASQIGIKAFAYKPMVKADLAKTVRKVLDEAKS